MTGPTLVPACFCQHIRFYVSMALPVSSQKSSNDEGSSRGGFRDTDSDFKKWFERGPWTWNDRPRATNPPADSHLCEACVCFLNLRIFGPSFRVVWLCIAEFCYGISILLEPLDSWEQSTDSLTICQLVVLWFFGWRNQIFHFLPGHPKHTNISIVNDWI